MSSAEQLVREIEKFAFTLEKNRKTCGALAQYLAKMEYEFRKELEELKQELEDLKSERKD